MASKVEIRVGVPASQARVWEVLADFEGWANWNPVYPRVDGRLSIGNPISFEQRLEGRPPETVQARVIDWVPYEQIHIGRTLARGWARSIRYMEIEPLGPESCIFSIGELFGGFLGDHVAKRERRALRAGFEAMAEALKAECAKAKASDPSAAPPAPDPAAKSPPEDAPPPSSAGRRRKSTVQPMKLGQFTPKPFGFKPPEGKG